MESRIFYSSKCYNLIENNCGTIYPKIIYLGCAHNLKRKVYLYFEVDSIPSEAMIESAYLIFYERNVGVHIPSEVYQYSIVPTLEFMNPYFYDYKRIRVAGGYRFVSQQASCNYMLKINITYLVENWVTAHLPNYGCLFELIGLQELRAFAGVQLSGVEPFLKVTYKMPRGKIFPCYDTEIELFSNVEISDKL